jgi:uncharacterized delta-60 repeat protein
MRIIFVLISILFYSKCFGQNLDASFGTNGIVTSQFSTSPSDDIPTTAAIQSDGKIVLIGLSNSLATEAFVARTNADGTLDTTFNAVGYRTFSGFGFEAVSIQPDGKIIVAGQEEVYRLNSNGSLDTTFGNYGLVQISINDNLMFIKSIGLVNTKIV